MLQCSGDVVINELGACEDSGEVVMATMMVVMLGKMVGMLICIYDDGSRYLW